MAQEGDIVFMIGADVAGLTRAGQTGEKSLAQMEKAAKDLERQIGKIGESGVAFQREMNKLSGVTRDVEKSARSSAEAFEAFERSKQQVDNLRASIDPLFAASKRYEQALHTLDGALEQGTISARQHAAMSDQLAAAYLRADGAAGTMGGRFAFLGNMSNEARGKLQQVGFQVQDFAVQVGAGTSATQAFAQQFPQMAGAFGQWGVLIGAAAAILVPLGAAFLSTADDADALTEAADRQKAAFEALTEAANRLTLERQMLFSGAEMTEEQVAMNELARLGAERVKLEAELANQIRFTGNARGAAQKAELEGKLASVRAETAKWQEALKTLAKEREMKTAAEGTKAVMESMRSIMGQLAGADISGPWQNVLGSIQAAINKAREYAATHMSLGKTYGVVGARGDPREFGANPGTSNTFDTENFSLPDSGGGGGGGGGQNPIEAQLEQLRQQMMTEEQIELESFAKRQEMLQQALDQRLLTQKEYAALMEQAQQEHSDKMSAIDVWRYGTGLDKAQAFFGGMASALQGGNEKMLAISKKFAAAEALINAWKGFSDVLADKTLPFWAKIPAAMKVLAAGMGAVNAIKGGGGGRSVAGGAGAGGGAAPQTPGQTLNFTITNDPFGIGERLARQIADRLNEAGRNGTNLRATVGVNA